MYEFTTLDAILDRDNLNDAYKQVVQNKGAAGVEAKDDNKGLKRLPKVNEWIPPS